MKVLAIGAHPDDVEIGAGGLLLKTAKSNNEVYIYVLTFGEAGGTDTTTRENEARESARTIGAKEIQFGEFEDTRLLPDGMLVNSIERMVNHVGPDLVLTHSVRDEHHDHKAVGSSTIEAARYCPMILAYENPLTKDFVPQHYADISDVIDEKIRLLSLFDTQKGKAYLIPDAIRGLAQYRAYQSRLNPIRFAEAFQVVKCTGNCLSMTGCTHAGNRSE
jgi:LmbE family N-acetylglucosaminyl deacetylase